MALSAYRSLLRSAKVAFAGDTTVFTAAILESRRGFEINRTASAAVAAALVKNAHDIADVLRRNVVQGRRVVEDEHTYRLQIHRDIERGDNESIKLGQGKMLPRQKGGCCQSS